MVPRTQQKPKYINERQLLFVWRISSNSNLTNPSKLNYISLFVILQFYYFTFSSKVFEKSTKIDTDFFFRNLTGFLDFQFRKQVILGIYTIIFFWACMYLTMHRWKYFQVLIRSINKKKNMKYSSVIWIFVRYTYF